jgi:hypothetical protein
MDRRNFIAGIIGAGVLPQTPKREAKDKMRTQRITTSQGFEFEVRQPKESFFTIEKLNRHTENVKLFISIEE